MLSACLMMISRLHIREAGKQAAESHTKDEISCGTCVTVCIGWIKHEQVEQIAPGSRRATCALAFDCLVAGWRVQMLHWLLGNAIVLAPEIASALKNE